MTSAPDPVVGEVRRDPLLEIDVECVGLDECGWARVRVSGSGGPRRESYPPDLWAEYGEAGRGR